MTGLNSMLPHIGLNGINMIDTAIEEYRKLSEEYQRLVTDLVGLLDLGITIDGDIPREALKDVIQKSLRNEKNRLQGLNLTPGKHIKINRASDINT